MFKFRVSQNAIYSLHLNFCYPLMLCLLSATVCAQGTTTDKLATLLERAQAAEKQGHFVSPTNANALHYYQQVLATQQDQYLAWIGMMKIAGNFLRSASLAITEQNSLRAEAALDNALNVMKVLGPIAASAPESETDSVDFYQTRYLYLKDRIRKEKRYWKVKAIPVANKSPSTKPLNQLTQKARIDLKNKPEPSNPLNTNPSFSGDDHLAPFVGRKLDIPNAALKTKSPQLQQRLQQVALAAREQRAFVLIVAPTDRAGRWMYDVMQKAISGYRLRGNIERGKPSVELQEP